MKERGSLGPSDWIPRGGLCFSHQDWGSLAVGGGVAHHAKPS